MHVGGWDYTNRANMLGVTPGNRRLIIDALQALGVDSPWATNAVLPAGTYDETGRFVEAPATSAFDEWIAEWPDASAASTAARIRPERSGGASGTCGASPSAVS